MSDQINYDEFSKIDLRIGTIIEVSDFPKARKPAYKLKIDFGHLGIKQSSAQITTLYTREELMNKQVVAVVNFPSKQIADFMSDCLVLGAVNANDVLLLSPERELTNGSRVS